MTNKNSSSRQIVLGGAGLVILVGLMAWLFIWPGYQSAAAVRRDVSELRAKIAGLRDENQQVRKLKEQVDALRKTVSTEYKVIPESPEVAELIRKLSLPVDGVSVTDQTFTAGAPERVEIAGSSSVHCLPLRVEMTATFESVFALVRAAESMSQLMRVSSIKVVCKRDEKSAGGDALPLLTASVGLEAIYDPPADEDGNGEEGGR